MKHLLSCIFMLWGLIAYGQTFMEGELPYEGSYQVKGEEKRLFTYRLLAKPYADINYLLICYGTGTTDTLYQWCNRVTQKSYLYRSGTDTLYEIKLVPNTDLKFENPNQEQATNYKEINGIMYMPVHVRGIDNTKIKIQYAAQERDCRFKEYRLFMAPFVYEFTSKSGKLMMYYDWSSENYKLSIKPNNRKAKLGTPYSPSPNDLVYKALPDCANKHITTGDPQTLWMSFMNHLNYSQK